MNTTPFSTPRSSSSTARPMRPVSAPCGRALVLGGGGSTGNAWLIGVIAGLLSRGLDLTTADLTVGTSAGATAAAQLVGETPTTLYAAITAASPQLPVRVADFDGGRARDRQVADHLHRLRAIIAAAEDAPDMRRRMGAAALERSAGSDGSWQAQWRATVAGRLPGGLWPERRLLITAVNAATGEPTVFDRHSGVDLTDAVAASCSSSRPYRIGESLYIDGGFRSNAENADLATGYEHVLVLAPLGGQSLHPPEWGTHVQSQIDDLRARGSSVETMFPDSSSRHLFGATAMDLSLRGSAARVGYNQGQEAVEQLTWFS